VVVALVNVPHVAPEQPAPESDQLTPLLAESFVTVAVKFWVKLTCTLGVLGLTATAIAGVTFTVANALLVPSAIEVAVSVTVAGEGTLAGAL
jgi:hypothetical protein